MEDFQSYDFPNQRVSNSVKAELDWYANCIDWIIGQGTRIKDKDDIVTKFRILKGDIPQEYYRKTLNPYNAKSDKYIRFPADMRNQDFIKGIIRRYVGEYAKDPHEFTVGANNVDVVMARNAKLRNELATIVQQKVAEQIKQNYENFVNQGGDAKQFNPQDNFDIEQFIKDFNDKYIDDISIQGQNILNVIKDITNDELFYIRTYFEFVSFGECYTYCDVVGDKIIKRVVSVMDAYPIPNDNMFVEDHDMFAERRKLTYQQIMDEFADTLSDEDIKFLDSYYAKNGLASTEDYTYNSYITYMSEMESKFSIGERELFSKQPNIQRDLNGGLFDVWHVVWRGEERVAIVTFQNPAGFIDTRIEEDSYKLNTAAGDISIDYEYKLQVYEGTRIGGRFDGIYPYKARAIAYNRNGKLPYNGVCELLPGFGKFSIIETLTPFQVFYNIVWYHREMAIAKNKMSLLLIAKSLVGSGEASEEFIYKMLATGVLYIDDSNDQALLKSQSVRMLNAENNEYINSLGKLLEETKQEAMDRVDMTMQRYGEIANSAGKDVTDQAIIRGSMGSVIIEYIMDSVRERDYCRDMDYTKLAWIDGLQTSYKDNKGEIKYLSLDVNNHIYADYVIKAVSSVKEREKLQQLKDFAFNASQNGDTKIAFAAITGDNVSAIHELINKFEDEKQQVAASQAQQEQQMEQLKSQLAIQQIQAKGEEDRKTKELAGYIDQQIKMLEADTNLIAASNVPQNDKAAAENRLNKDKSNVDFVKLQLENKKINMDAYKTMADNSIKLKDMQNKLQIAKTNKNRYDNKSSK